MNSAQSNKIAFQALVGVLFLMLFTCGTIFWHTIRTRDVAGSVLRDVGDLQVGQATFADAQRISTRYSRYLMSSSEPCTPTNCLLVFGFDNRWLSSIGLTRLTTFTAQLQVSNGKVTWIELMMATHPATKVFVEEFPSGAQASAYVANGKLITAHPSPRAILIDVKFTPEANPVQKNAALAFDLNCLTKLGGCKYGEEMLPRIRLGDSSADK